MTSIWVTWIKQRRNFGMARRVGAELHVLLSNRHRLARYAELLIRTFSLLRQKRPAVVYCQNPSIVLAVFTVLMRRPFGYRLCVDQHNAGLLPLDGRSRILLFFANYVKKNADLCIVSNRSLVPDIEARGGRAVVCPDPLPEIGEEEKPENEDRKRTILVISSWADDEPYREVLAAAATVADEKLVFCFTGSPPPDIKNQPTSANVRLAGFIPDREYERLVHSAYAIMILTKRESCLNCGAYEALAAGTPMILSDTQALRQTFPRSAVFVDNTAPGIRDGCAELAERYDQLLDGIPHDRASITQSVDDGVHEISHRLGVK